MPDSLEGWVAVKEQPFKDISPKTKIDFHVAWNEVEGKVSKQVILIYIVFLVRNVCIAFFEKTLYT